MPRLSKIGAAALAAFGWTGLQSVTATYLIVAGGGGAGSTYAGGGGAGGLLTSTTSLNPTLSYTITVGAGGAGGVSSANGVQGSNSSITGLTAAVGGGFGRNDSGAGGAGGSGGGSANGGAGGTATSGQGNTGGVGPSTGSAVTATGGGGGGAGAVGGNGSAGVSGIGGAGSASSITGSSVTYAGGGGGGSGTGGAGGGGAGGAGGGGTGGQTSGASGTSGTANLGGGGGGGSAPIGATGGSGGSGIVIISYVGAQQFSGGVVTSVGGNTIHTFTTSGTLGPITPLLANYLVVAGGGAGGGQYGGGGGAGGLLTGSGLVIDPYSTYLVTVGSGGSGATGADGTKGSDSVFFAITSTGGGYGGINSAGSGGSGGGGGCASTQNNGAAGNTPSTSPSQGNNGGNSGAYSGGFVAGGGGGAGAVGQNAPSNTQAGAGGNGTASSISGSSVTYAGGGGGGGGVGGTAGAGGSGGGGAGTVGTAGTAGTANLGGGGGGGGVTSPGRIGGAGGSGVVIISYAGATQLMAGGTVTISGGNVIHTFTSTGFLAPIELVSNSLRFRSSASAYLNRTPTNTATNGQIFTISFWVKRGTLGVQQKLWGTPSNYEFADFLSSDALRISNPSGTPYWTTNQVFRDPAAWYHLVMAFDTTQATASNRLRAYVNGVEITSWASNSTITQNSTSARWGVSGYANYIGQSNSADYSDVYMAEFNYIDGQALTPSSFGTTNSYGVWQPITYGGSYGTNGFYLPFTNTTSTTTLGYDFSPQGNNWTTNNISLTSGSTYDSMTDVPTLTSATAANYCVMNPLKLQTNMRLTNGNLDVSSTDASSAYCAFGSIVMSSGSWYAEYTINTSTGNYPQAGIGDLVKNPNTNEGLGDSDGVAYQRDGRVIVSGSTIGTFATFTNGDVIGVAYDATNNRIYFAKNNTYINSGNPSAGTGYFSPAAPVLGYVFGTSTYSAGSCSINFGQQPFVYTAPSGFVALNTYNL